MENEHAELVALLVALLDDFGRKAWIGGHREACAETVGVRKTDMVAMYRSTDHGFEQCLVAPPTTGARDGQKALDIGAVLVCWVFHFPDHVVYAASLPEHGIMQAWRAECDANGIPGDAIAIDHRTLAARPET